MKCRVSSGVQRSQAAYSLGVGLNRTTLRRKFGSRTMWRLDAVLAVIFGAQAVLWVIAAGSDTGPRKVVDIALTGLMTIGAAIFAFASVMLFREGREPGSH